MTDQNYTHLMLVVDRSGSMSAIEADMNGSIRALMDDQKEVPGKILVDIVTFDSLIETPFSDCVPDDIPSDVIHARGATALNDATGVSIVRMGNKLALMPEEERPGHVIIVVVTDGGENASREYTLDQVKTMVEKQTNEFGWTFIYLAANVDAFATGAGYGYAAGSTISYAASPIGTQNAMGSASRSVKSARLGQDESFTQAERDAAGASQ